MKALSMRRYLVLGLLIALVPYVIGECEQKADGAYILDAPNNSVNVHHWDTVGIKISGGSCTGENVPVEGITGYKCTCTGDGNIDMYVNLAETKPPVQVSSNKIFAEKIRLDSDSSWKGTKSVTLDKCYTTKNVGAHIKVEGKEVTVKDSTIYHLVATGTGELNSRFQFTGNKILGAIKGYDVEEDYKVVQAYEFGYNQVTNTEASDNGNVQDVPAYDPMIIGDLIIKPNAGDENTATVNVENWGTAAFPLGYILVSSTHNCDSTIEKIHTRWVPCVSVLGDGDATVKDVSIFSSFKSSSLDRTCALQLNGVIEYKDIKSGLQEGEKFTHKDYITFSGMNSNTTYQFTDINLPHLSLNYIDTHRVFVNVHLKNVVFDSFFPVIEKSGDKYISTGSVFDVYGIATISFDDVEQLQEVTNTHQINGQNIHFPEVSNNIVFTGRYWSSIIWLSLLGPASFKSGLVVTNVTKLELAQGETIQECTWSSIVIDHAGLGQFDCPKYTGSDLKITNSFLYATNYIHGENFNIEFKNNRVTGGDNEFSARMGDTDVNVLMDPMYGTVNWVNTMTGKLTVTPSDYLTNTAIASMPQPYGPGSSHFYSKSATGSRIRHELYMDAHYLGNGTIMENKTSVPLIYVETEIGKANLAILTDKSSAALHKPFSAEQRKLVLRGFDTVNVFSRSTYPTRGALLNLPEIMTYTTDEAILHIYIVDMENESSNMRKVTNEGNTFTCVGGMKSQRGPQCVAHVILPDHDIQKAPPTNAVSLDVETFLFVSFIPTSAINSLVAKSVHFSFIGGIYNTIDISVFKGTPNEHNDMLISVHNMMWINSFSIQGDTQTHAQLWMHLTQNIFLFGEAVVNHVGWFGDFSEVKTGQTDVRHSLQLRGVGTAWIKTFEGKTHAIPHTTDLRPSIEIHESTSHGHSGGNFLYVMKVKDLQRPKFVAFGGNDITGEAIVKIIPSIVDLQLDKSHGLNVSCQMGYLLVPEDGIKSYTIDGSGMLFLAGEFDVAGITARSRNVYANKLHADVVVAHMGTIFDFKAASAQFNGTSTLGLYTADSAYNIVKENSIVMSTGAHHSNPVATEYLPDLFTTNAMYSAVQNYMDVDALWPEAYCYDTECHYNTTTIKDCMPSPIYFACAAGFNTANPGSKEYGKLTLRNGHYILYTRDFDASYRDPGPNMSVKLTGAEIAIITVDSIVLAALVGLALFFFIARDTFKKVFCCCCNKSNGTTFGGIN